MYIFGNGTLIVSVRSGAPARRARWRAGALAGQASQRAGRAGAPSHVHTTVLTSQILNLDKLTQGGRFIYDWPSPALVAWCRDKIGHVHELSWSRPRHVSETFIY